LSLLCVLLPARARALDVGDESSLASMKVHAFVSQGRTGSACAAAV